MKGGPCSYSTPIQLQWQPTWAARPISPDPVAEPGQKTFAAIYFYWDADYWDANREATVITSGPQKLPTPACGT